MADQTRAVQGRNGFAGKPPVAGMGQCYYTLTVTIAGEPDNVGGYLVNIKHIDDAVRDLVVPHVKDVVRGGCQGNARGGGGVVLDAWDKLQHAFTPHQLATVTLALSPYTRLTTDSDLAPKQMLRLTHTFEFAASHRLHNDQLSEDENHKLFGKCNNPHGHGHNYVVEVTIVGTPDKNGHLSSIDDLERIVDERVISPLDHKHLNVEVEEFKTLNPSVENIAKVCFDRLEGSLDGKLDSVRVWETPKTWCEYRRDD